MTIDLVLFVMLAGWSVIGTIVNIFNQIGCSSGSIEVDYPQCKETCCLPVFLLVSQEYRLTEVHQIKMRQTLFRAGYGNIVEFDERYVIGGAETNHISTLISPDPTTKLFVQYFINKST